MPRWPILALLAALAAATGCGSAGGLRLGPQEVGSAKAALALLGTLWLAARLLLERRGALGRGAERILDVGLLLLGVAAAAAWWNLFQFNYPMFGHPSETYHYYVGSKYFRELGYTRLYRCTALADAEAGRDDTALRSLRNLETNAVEPAARSLADPQACKAHFTPQRWRDFARDVAWFRSRLPARRWQRTQLDHGYNGTPAWGFFGWLLARTGTASDVQILALRLVDPALLVLAWALVGATFGWRTLCVALLFWGTNYPAQYGWVGGSYLRQLEVVALLAGLCLARRERNVAAGFLLCLAALVRIYPALLLAGPGLAAAARSLAARRLRLDRAERGLLLGGLLGLAVLMPLSVVGTGSARAWLEFAENSRVLLDTPLRNDMGLRTLLAWEPGTRARDLSDPGLRDPYEPWKRARAESFAPRRPLFALLLAGYVGLLALAVRGQPLWVALVLAAGLVPMAVELTCYYAVVLVVFALLWERHPPVGIALCGLSAVGWAIVDRFHFFDEIFTWISLASVLFVLFATVWAWRVPARARRPSAAAGDGD
jgi:hypothetical protein